MTFCGVDAPPVLSDLARLKILRVSRFAAPEGGKSNHFSAHKLWMTTTTHHHTCFLDGRPCCFPLLPHLNVNCKRCEQAHSEEQEMTFALVHSEQSVPDAWRRAE
jgi:hypothetical protein